MKKFFENFNLRNIIGALSGSENSKMSKKVAVVCTAVLLCVATAATMALVTWVSEPVKNIFLPPTVEAEVEEEFDGEEKTSVKVENTGTISEFVRVAVVVNWKDESGNVSAKSVKSTDYTFSVNETDWTLNGKYWYYNTALESGEKTAEFLADGSKVALTAAGEINAPDGYVLSVEILVEAIQATPTDAIKDAWGLDAEDGAIKFEEATE